MSALLAFVVEWGPLVLLVFLGSLVPVVVRALYWGAHKRLDAAHPDDLPLPAGRWLEEEVSRRGLDLRVLVAPSKEDGVDAFIPSAGIITLTQTSYVKKDPAYWGGAAHELGHALVRRRSRALDFLLTTSRVCGFWLRDVAHYLILTNILFASRVMNEVAFAAATVGAALYVVVLVEEVAASAIALRILRGDPRIDRVAWRSARSALVWAFVTYLGGFAGQLILLAERDFVVAKIEQHRHFVPAPPPGSASLVIAGVLSIVLLSLAGSALLGALRTQPAATVEEATRSALRRWWIALPRSLMTLGILAIVWDQPLGLVFAFACALAVLASRAVIDIVSRPVVSILSTPVAILFLLVLFLLVMVNVLLKRRAGPKPESVRPPDKADLERSEAALTEWQIQSHNRPPWYELASRLSPPALQIGFVVLFWSSYVWR